LSPSWSTRWHGSWCGALREGNRREA